MEWDWIIAPSLDRTPENAAAVLVHFMERDHPDGRVEAFPAHLGLSLPAAATCRLLLCIKQESIPAAQKHRSETMCVCSKMLGLTVSSFPSREEKAVQDWFVKDLFLKAVGQNYPKMLCADLHWSPSEPSVLAGSRGGVEGLLSAAFSEGPCSCVFAAQRWALRARARPNKGGRWLFLSQSVWTLIFGDVDVGPPQVVNSKVRKHCPVLLLRSCPHRVLSVLFSADQSKKEGVSKFSSCSWKSLWRLQNLSGSVHTSCLAHTGEWVKPINSALQMCRFIQTFHF